MASYLVQIREAEQQQKLNASSLRRCGVWKFVHKYPAKCVHVICKREKLLACLHAVRQLLTFGIYWDTKMPLKSMCNVCLAFAIRINESLSKCHFNWSRFFCCRNSSQVNWHIQTSSCICMRSGIFHFVKIHWNTHYEWVDATGRERERACARKTQQHADRMTLSNIVQLKRKKKKQKANEIK